MSRVKVQARILVALMILFGSACSIAQMAVGDGTSGEPAQSQASTTGTLQAEVASPVSVLLTWEPVSSASGYTLEVKFSDEDYLPAADLAPDETTFEHFVLAGTRDLSYRLTATTTSGSREVGTASIALPPFAPDPLTVEPKLFEPQFNLEGFDPSNPLPPGFDPNNPGAFDPSTLFPPGFDPENPEAFDPSSMVQIVSAAEEIGPDGGSLSVTSPDGAIYTLDVPAGAVYQPITFTLTPVESIGGLPLSGGLLGAVRVQPEGFAFNRPARLTIEPAVSSSNAAAPLTIGFAVSPYAQEFFLYPLAAAEPLTSDPTGGDHLARTAPSPLAQASSSSLSVGSGATYGTGAGTQQDVQAQARRVPSNSGDQTAQHNARQQYVHPERAANAFLETATSIQIKMLAGDSAGSLSRLTADLEQYWQDGGSEYNQELNGRLLERYASKLKSLFDRVKGDCLTSEDVVASDLAEKLTDASSDFWKRVAEAYRSKFGEAGQKSLADLYEGKKSCSYTLEIVSTIRLESVEGWAEAKVHTATPIVLRPSRGGDPSTPTGYRLYGNGAVEYVSYEFRNKGCPVTKVTQYPRVNLDVVGLFPEFGQDNRVFDFWFRYFELGSNWTQNVNLNTREDKRGCVTSANLIGGGDVWSGGFVLLRSEAGLRYWDFTSTSYPLVFTKQIKAMTLTIPGGAGTLTENATYTITIQRASRP